MREPHNLLYSPASDTPTDIDFLHFPPQIKRMFALADKDKDGKLSVAEWEQMLVQAGAPADKSVRFYIPDKKSSLVCFYGFNKTKYFVSPTMHCCMQF